MNPVKEGIGDVFFNRIKFKQRTVVKVNTVDMIFCIGKIIFDNYALRGSAF